MATGMLFGLLSAWIGLFITKVLYHYVCLKKARALEDVDFSIIPKNRLILFRRLVSAGLMFPVFSDILPMKKREVINTFVCTLYIISVLLIVAMFFATKESLR